MAPQCKKCPFVGDASVDFCLGCGDNPELDYLGIDDISETIYDDDRGGE